MSGEPIRLDAVVFDLDGTIAETFPMAVELIGEAIVRGGGPALTADEIIARFGPNEQGILRDAIGQGWETAWDWYLDAYRERHDLAPEPFAGISRLLGELHARGCRLGLVTGKTALTGSISLEYYGLSGLFDGVEGGDRDHHIKEACLRRFMDRWGLEAARMAYVGDTAGDVEQSRRAGVRAVAAAWSDFADRDALAAAGPDRLFDTVEAMSSWALAATADLGMA